MLRTFMAVVCALHITSCNTGHVFGSAARDVAAWATDDHFAKVMGVEETTLDDTDHGDEYYLLRSVIASTPHAETEEAWRLRARKLCRVQSTLLPRRTASFRLYAPEALRSYTLSQRSIYPTDRARGRIEYDEFMRAFERSQQDIAWFLGLKERGVHSFEWNLEDTGLDESEPLLAAPLDVEAIDLWRDERNLRQTR